MTQKKIYFSLLSVLVIIAACKKSNHNPPDVFNAAIGSFNYQGGKITASFIENQFSIFGLEKNDTDQLTLKFPGPVQLDSPISKGSIVYWKPAVYWNSFNSGSGLFWIPTDGHNVITVTSWDSVSHRIAGTFTSEMYTDQNDSLSQTNGTFNVTYSLN